MRRGRARVAKAPNRSARNPALFPRILIADLDAYEIESLDFRVVTCTRQDNNTQRWCLNPVGGDLFTIHQLSSGRVLEAYSTAAKDVQVVTRPRSGNARQVWEITNANILPSLVGRLVDGSGGPRQPQRHGEGAKRCR